MLKLWKIVIRIYPTSRGENNFEVDVIEHPEVQERPNGYKVKQSNRNIIVKKSDIGEFTGHGEPSLFIGKVWLKDEALIDECIEKLHEKLQDRIKSYIDFLNDRMRISSGLLAASENSKPKRRDLNELDY
jgi:hypothetical protein